jgi:hypothetical protein
MRPPPRLVAYAVAMRPKRNRTLRAIMSVRTQLTACDFLFQRAKTRLMTK